MRDFRSSLIAAAWATHRPIDYSFCREYRFFEKEYLPSYRYEVPRPSAILPP